MTCKKRFCSSQFKSLQARRQLVWPGTMTVFETFQVVGLRKRILISQHDQTPKPLYAGYTLRTYNLEPKRDVKL